MRIGIIGAGHLASALMEGLARAGLAGGVALSPRGRGAELAARHGAALAGSNAEVVERSDAVLLCVRPADAPRAVHGLPWRSGQILLSACAGVPLAALSAAAPARAVRIMPITAASLGASPTLVFPDLPEVRPLLAAWGPAIPLAGEAQFEAGTVHAAIYGWAQDLIRLSARRSAAHGLQEAEARRLAARTFVAAGRMMDETGAPMDEILAALVTPGGITEAGLRHLADAEVPAAWEGACDLVFARLTGAGGSGGGAA